MSQRRFIQWIFGIGLGLILCFSYPRILAARESIALSNSESVQQGIILYQRGDFPGAITLWETALQKTNIPLQRAIISNNLSLAYREIGELSRAIQGWETAIQIYQSLGNQTESLAAVLTEQSQAYSDLGQYRQAIPKAEKVLKLTQKPDILLAAYGVIGNSHWLLGDYLPALSAHQRSLQQAEKLENTPQLTTILNNLGMVYASLAKRDRTQAIVSERIGESDAARRLSQSALEHSQAAENAFLKSLELGKENITTVQSLLNLNRLWEESPNLDGKRLQQNREKSLLILEKLPNNRRKIFAYINIASSLRRQSPHQVSPQVMSLLQQAQTIAQSIGDVRAESFAVGSLGEIYALSQDYEAAQKLTQQAIYLAQKNNSLDSLYRWQWQLARIQRNIGDRKRALQNYQQSIASLQGIQGDVVVSNKDLQFNFRDDVEPVYREQMELLLEDNPQSSEIQLVVNTLELLKLAELQNFFGDECVQVARRRSQDTSQIQDPTAAIIYSVVFGNYIQTILQLPDGTLSTYRVNLSLGELQQRIERFRPLLESRISGRNRYIIEAQNLYDDFIRPLDEKLTASQIKTLIFINDSQLRLVPMAVLHDGEKFLVEKYAIATTPSINLTIRQPSEKRRLNNALILGLSVSRPPFAPLLGVEAEVKTVQEILGGTTLVDQEFTLQNFQGRISNNNHPIVHMATHGQFGVDSSTTFLLGYDTEITIEEVDQILRNRRIQQPVRLLTLSACQTAAGDNRSALGIAGVAVRAGVETAVATLWSINDATTVPLIAEFYTQLQQPDITTAQALQKAQIKMLENRATNHPGIWSPFILIGNWM